MIISRREKLLILLLAVLIVLSGLYFLVSGILSYQSGLSKQILSSQTLLTRAKVLVASASLLRGRSGAGTKLKGSLIGHIERLAASTALKDRIQLNRVPLGKAKRHEAIDIKLDKLALDEMAGFMYAIENSRPKLIVDQMEISPSIRARNLLRLSARVLAQK
ncbi:MAG: hypothetical protein O7E56_13935 [SAR324 cluster bacterium]|nr:hypothetical protein [SAR324 cluster bacterium]MCZ6558008.1 hypothetical protein [SAR324 cluster bacterium]MCZ6629317.1 hypothetical protein [SAR324 cluster bacterium]MCZ6646027.1 hypothetical protein [SAR324 cluster bacterium]MCZ6844160.1 hypothetical protein [SAR324 cluster bacterium]